MSQAVTELLKRWRGGDETARDALLRELYADLRRLAERRLRGERAGHTLQATALVHEAYMRLIDQSPEDPGAPAQPAVEMHNRAHFLALAARVMRNILVDHARARAAQKRDGGIAVTIESTDDLMTPQPGIDVVQLHDALARLAELDREQAQIVELRFFGGLTLEETAEVMGSSPATVKREWTMARAWLRREIAG